MTRPLRIEYPGAVYHVTSRGNRRANIYTDEEDHKAFLVILGEMTRRYHVLCHAYCLMGNHYHLLLETVEGNLCRAMRYLNGVYTQIFNRKHHKCGHVFQGRYKAVLIQKSSHLLEVCRYVVLNPVRADIVEKPEDWPWSSYRATAGHEQGPVFLTTEWVLSEFDGERQAARKKYAEFVSDGNPWKMWEDVVSGVVLGENEFAEQCRLLSHGEGDITEVPREQRYVNRPSLAEVLSAPGSRAAGWLSAVEEFGYTQKGVARHSGVHYSYVSRMLKRERSKVKT